MKPLIRRAVHEDAANIINAHKRSIKELCSKDYSPEQIAAWSGFNFQENHWHKMMDKDLVWVISDDQNNIFGFGHLKFHEKSEAEIGGLYFVPEVVGQGFGKNIFLLMLDECRKRDIHSISITATKTAKAFYENVGFIQLGPQTSLKIGNQEIECFKMLQSLIKTP